MRDSLREDLGGLNSSHQGVGVGNRGLEKLHLDPREIHQIPLPFLQGGNGIEFKIGHLVLKIIGLLNKEVELARLTLLGGRTWGNYWLALGG